MSGEVVDLRGRAERRVRSAWTGSPGVLLRAAGALYGAVEETRHFLHDVGVLAAWHPGVPVVSVGGLSVGGSGKTPVAAEVARWLRGAGLATAVLTHGYRDEMAVHRELAGRRGAARTGIGETEPGEWPPLLVVGSRDREEAAARAVALGARALVVDSGFQRRRLARDFDLLALSEAELTDARRRLPAGPLREGWASAGRADALVVVHRSGRPRAAGATDDWLAARLPGLPVARLSLAPGELRPANRAAEGRLPRSPAAVSSVMDPDGFARALAERGLSPRARFVLPDHGEIGPGLADRLREGGRDGGIVATLKERSKLLAVLGEETPLWILPDEPSWGAGGEELRRSVLRSAGVRA